MLEQITLYAVCSILSMAGIAALVGAAKEALEGKKVVQERDLTEIEREFFLPFEKEREFIELTYKYKIN